MDDPPAMDIVSDEGFVTDDPPAMDLFPDGGFVRLRSVRQGTYAVADEDAVGVSLRPTGQFHPLNAVWKAQYGDVDVEGGPFLLLQSAAYGRYLAVSNVRAEPPSLCMLTVVRDIHSPDLDVAFMWTPYGGVNNTVCLSNWGQGTYLCSGGWPGDVEFRPTPVTVDEESNLSTHWRVEPIQSSRVPLPLPPRPPPRVVNVSDEVLAGYPEPARLKRTIRHVRATNEGHLHHLDLMEWPRFSYTGRSVLLLRNEIWLRQGILNVPGIRLCVRAGLHAALIPLVTDLPDNSDPMDIIAYNIGSPADQKLVYPQSNDMEEFPVAAMVELEE